MSLKFVPEWAKQVVGLRMRTKGKYAKGWPLGAVVHHTAGRDGAEKTLKGGAKDGYAFWCIQKDGQMYVAHSANEWGWHCGESKWTKFVKKLIGSCNDDLIGIEINAAGNVKPTKEGKYVTWFKTVLGPDEVRYSAGVDNQAKGYYEKFTPQQENTLIEALLWLKAQRPDVFDFDLVLGHDEVSGVKGLGYFRKTDPGASLSMTMSEFRELLKKKWAERS